MQLKQEISRLTLVPSSGGCFEVSVNGKQVYSKLQSGQFPDPDAVLKAVRTRR